MQIKHGYRLSLLWVVLSVFLTVFLIVASQSLLKDGVEQRVRQHILSTVEESHFSNEKNRVNDHKALQHIAQQMGVALRDLVNSRWYAVQQDCLVSLEGIDDVVIGDDSMGGGFVFSLQRNGIERQVALGFSCSLNWTVLIGLSAALALLFVAISFFLPQPLSHVHRRWINSLLGDGYSGEQAYAIISQYDTSRLDLSLAQLRCVEHLHDIEQHNFSEVLDIVTDERVVALGEADVDWFLLGLEGGSRSLADALGLASAEDTVVINLREKTLTIHGLQVPISRTPLFYYAWYAMSRVGGEGWLTNPASNRPDIIVGRELAELMERYDGHARAINDLEQAGLKARTLDQNRSKIKEDVASVLGEELAAAYLFETIKHPDGIHTRYRLRMNSETIQIVF